jgi:hypothetical protein
MGAEVSTRRTYRRFVEMLNRARVAYPHLVLLATDDDMWYVLSLPVVGVGEPIPPYSYGSGLWEALEGFVDSCVPGEGIDAGISVDM